MIAVNQKRLGMIVSLDTAMTGASVSIKLTVHLKYLPLRAQSSTNASCSRCWRWCLAFLEYLGVPSSLIRIGASPTSVSWHQRPTSKLQNMDGYILCVKISCLKPALPYLGSSQQAMLVALRPESSRHHRGYDARFCTPSIFASTRATKL